MLQKNLPLPFTKLLSHKISCGASYYYSCWYKMKKNESNNRSYHNYHENLRKTQRKNNIFFGVYIDDDSYMLLHQRMNFCQNSWCWNIFSSWFGFPFLNGFECRIFPQLSNIINTSFLDLISIQQKRKHKLKRRIKTVIFLIIDLSSYHQRNKFENQNLSCELIELRELFLIFRTTVLKIFIIIIHLDS